MSVLRRLEFSSSDSEDERPSRKKTFRPRINYEVPNEFCFKEKFRLRYEEVEYVLNKIGSILDQRTTRNKAFTPRQQLLTALHWMGNGAQYHGTADMHGIVKSSVCKILKRVVAAVNEKMFQCIVKWPENTSNIPVEFYRKGKFPNVCGCVDGTLINIMAPTENEEQFVDRHGNHSINVMGICGPDLTFYHVTARWPGSVHDSRVMRNSTIGERFISGWRPFPDAVLLGDSAYKLQEWLITPFHENPNDEAEQQFNIAHKSCRRLIECAYGVLKNRFPCLRLLRVNPDYASKIVTACITLHNIATKEDFEWSESQIYSTQTEIREDENHDINTGADPRGIARVRELIAFFS